MRAPADGTGVEGGGHTQVDAALPDGVVVIGAVDAEAVLVEDEVSHLGMLALHAWHGPQHVTGEHCCLQPESDRVLQLLDRLRRGVHRHDRGGCQPVVQTTEHLGVVQVEGARRRPAEVVVWHARQRDHEQAHARVDDAEVEPDLVHALVQQPWQHGGGAVERVLGGHRPPHRHGGTRIEALLGGHPERAPDVAHVGDPPVRHVGAADVAEEVEEHRHHLELVRVGIDDRMVDAFADLGQGGMSVRDGRCHCSTSPDVSGRSTSASRCGRARRVGS